MGLGVNSLVGPGAGAQMRGDPSYMNTRNVYDHDTRVIDGTPLGAAGIILVAGLVLVALKAAKFEFVIGVGR